MQSNIKHKANYIAAADWASWGTAAPAAAATVVLYSQL